MITTPLQAPDFGSAVPLYSSFYIMVFRDEAGEWEVMMCVDVKHLLLRVRPFAPLLYYRKFDNLFDALGHRLLLERLSDESLYQLVQNTNFEMKDKRRNLW